MKLVRIALIAGTVGAIAAGLALPVLAQPGPDAPRRPAPGFAMGEAFARADSNNDGQVSRDEGWAWLQAQFATLDTNRDSGVTMEEANAFWQARRGGNRPMPERAREHGQGMFRALDANSDGRVTLEEVRPFAEAMFRARDANTDGQLSREEVQPRRMHHRHHGSGDDRRGPARMPGSPGAPGSQGAPGSSN